MARQIHVSLGAKESIFDFVKIDRSKLYGKRTRLVLDDEGKACVKAELSDDGTTIIRAGMTQQAYFDEEGEWVEHSELIGLSDEGEPVEAVPSTLGVSQELAPATPEELSQNHMLAVYLLSPAEVDEALTAALAAGDLFKFPFSYRGGYALDTAFLLGNEEGLFVLVTRDATPEWCQLEQVAVETFSDEGELDDALDFEMF